MIKFHKPPLWRQILRTNFVRWDKLADYLELSNIDREQIDIKPDFPLNLPLRIARKIPKQTLDNPLLRQFLPTLQEKKASASSFVEDPTQDRSFCKTPKLLQKYRGRALLVCTSACAMHCRYCFRQNFDYDQNGLIFENEIAVIEQDSTLKEIILSGGDPLSLSNDTLKELLDRLAAIPHVRRIRFHTRFPVGIPERIDEELLNLLRSIPKQIWIIVHVNHALELDEEVLAAFNSIQKCGIVVMNQSVLLHGVNDTVEALKELCERLVDNGVVPYYLHQLDKVAGAEHFEVPMEKGLQLIAQLRKELSGYAVPLYAAEIPGEASKTPLF